ncbi:MAG: S24 family peptidase [bacterium]
MHKLQKALLELVSKRDLAGMTLREIGEFIGEPHPQKIKHHLGQLKAKGFLSAENQPVGASAGKIKVSPLGFLSIPILGAANCGEAQLFADEFFEGYLQVSPSMVPKRKELFAVKAVGSSMNRANVEGKTIDEGDYVIVDRGETKPKDGDYVLSIVGGQANIKRFVKDTANKQILLLSESSQDLPPIYIHFKDLSHYHVNGKVVQVIKKPPMRN